MERANLEVNSAFMLYGLTFAGVVYAGNKIIGATSATLEPAYPSVSQMGGFLNVFDWNCGVGKPFDQFISISADHSKATHAILTIEGGLPEGLDEGTPVRQYVVGKAAQVLSPIPAAAVPAAAVPAAAVPAAAAALAMVAAAPPPPTFPSPVTVGTLAAKHPNGATRIFVKLEPAGAGKTSMKHFRTARGAKLRFGDSVQLFTLASSTKLTYWQAAPSGIDYRLAKIPVPFGKDPAHALGVPKRRAVWYGQVIRALALRLTGQIGRNIDLSDIELEFDLPSQLSRIDWNDGAPKCASIDLGEGKIQTWPFMHCVVLPFANGWRNEYVGQRRQLEEEIVALNTSYGVSGVDKAVEDAGKTAKELLCKCSEAVNDLVRLSHSTNPDP
jgi:hypothetical protein